MVLSSQDEGEALLCPSVGPVGFSLLFSLFYELAAGGPLPPLRRPPSLWVDAAADAQFAAAIVDQYLRLERLLE